MRHQTTVQVSSKTRQTALALTFALVGMVWSGPAALANTGYKSGHDAGLRDISVPDDGYIRSLARYVVPAVDMVDNDGRKVPLARVLEGDNPVMLNFIFTSCGAICPVMSATFAKVQAELGPKSKNLLLVSISIDPEQDTPLALRNYARHYGAGPRWRMFTGSLDSSIAVQRAFNAYRGDKMNHVPLTFIRTGAKSPWVRIEGFANADDLIREYRLLASK